MPLQLQVRSPAGLRSFQLNEAGNRFEALDPQPDWPQAGAVWQGRQHQDDVTIDLRLE